MNPDLVKAQIAAAKALAADPKYHERAHSQMLSWAMGKPYHEPHNDECCPDFSCCFPDLFTTDATERWARYQARYGAHQ
jgi:hypothetical protein